MNNLSEISEYDSDGGLVSKQTFNYDINNRLTEEAVFEGDNVLAKKKNYTYNDLDLKTQEIEYDSDGKQIQKLLFNYDSAKRIKTVTGLNLLNEPVYEIRYSYELK
jgi:hypothetical protein